MLHVHVLAGATGANNFLRFVTGTRNQKPKGNYPKRHKVARICPNLTNKSPKHQVFSTELKRIYIHIPQSETLWTEIA